MLCRSKHSRSTSRRINSLSLSLATTGRTNKPQKGRRIPCAMSLLNNGTFLTSLSFGCCHHREEEKKEVIGFPFLISFAVHRRHWKTDESNSFCFDGSMFLSVVMDEEDDDMLSRSNCQSSWTRQGLVGGVSAFWVFYLADPSFCK